MLSVYGERSISKRVVVGDERLRDLKGPLSIPSPKLSLYKLHGSTKSAYFLLPLLVVRLVLL